MDPDELIDVLDTLIETSEDGEVASRLCADRARAPALRTLLQRRADEWRQATLDLQAAVQRHGGRVRAADGADPAQRGWVAAGTLATGCDDDLIVDECERGEDLALRQYADAIASALPADVHSMVQRHLEAVTRHHDQIRRLRDELHARI